MTSTVQCACQQVVINSSVLMHDVKNPRQIGQLLSKMPSLTENIENIEILK